jgi:ABC-type molybdenum transport system ATPase subunit/photorepair protein PhrA
MKNWLIRIRKADVFLNGKQVLHSIDWTMKRKENWAVVGINGAGKTC